jgi:RNA-dependent RNA polymerase
VSFAPLVQAKHQVQPEPHFRPRDLKRLGYPVDQVVSQFPVYHSLLEALRPIKAQYEQGMQHDMRQYRVFEPEIPAGIALRNKRRKRAKQTELTVCSAMRAYE